MADGMVLYEGPSMIDGKPIVVIATGLRSGSANVKTGAMVQTYILRADVAPTDAIRSGADSSICGACPHRGDGTGAGRTCYVNVGQGPLSVWRAYQRGGYRRVVDDAPFVGRVVRFGTYGDPAAAPLAVWDRLAAVARGWTGYTHQWRTNPGLQRYCMASADSPADAREAQSAGWRTFRVSMPGDPARLESEALCPASAEAGKKLTCERCLACGGGARRGSITIAAHGGFAVMANVRKRVAA